ncbi:hypothetical protein PZA22_06925 [Pectobacterium polaris]|uniref:hypothetical protein n=1 Tax=Pectobacterium polaris TaxID=2042057 RepID=UPI0023B035D4|nr:hypothetical protein [Pectobacterium polaris]MDE8754237.1 hypothetical protein [Pectobacterium polaris]
MNNEYREALGYSKVTRQISNCLPGETLSFYKPGEWVFFQQAKENCSGYWLGKTYDFVFMLEIPHPVSIAQELNFMS